jgi:NAD(P)-dependent dehydrogenase (short-subunit alcohol dehydrogenase family)
MKIDGRVVVVTGAAGGIGRALVRRFEAAGAAAVVGSDLGLDGVDVTREADIQRLVGRVLDEHGRIDLFCSNAGILTGQGIEAPDELWQRTWEVNVRAHLYAARAVLPSMLERGSGYLLQTCSAAGLLTAVGDAPYSVTKHAAVGFAEWLAIEYGGRGITVSALCPQGVDTPMLTDGLEQGHVGARVTAASGPVLTPDQVADAAVAGIAEERFLILPHPEVATYFGHKAADHDRWLAGMRRLASSHSSSSSSSHSP